MKTKNLAISMLSLLCLANSLFSQTTAIKSPVVNERSIQLSTGVSLNYVEQGDPKGVPVIFLHGYSDSWRSFEIIMKYLPSNIHAFSLTQRGHGNSSKNATSYTSKDLAADVAAFISKKKLGPVIIAGHSMGGVAAQQFVIDYPKLTKALVIIDSDASFKDNPGMPEFFNQIIEMPGPISYQFADEFQRSTIAKPIDSTELKMYVGESLKMPLNAWKQIAKTLRDIDLTNEVKNINKPTLIFWGDKDGICLKSDQDALSRAIKNSRLLVYEGTGHALHWEEPKRFAADLVSFINSLQ